ncbi:MAG: hypothetical protein QGG10_08585, partial [Arenicellales bacterium]|nr:hypothetical protein [Arenicellales bacterium]
MLIDKIDCIFILLRSLKGKYKETEACRIYSQSATGATATSAVSEPAGIAILHSRFWKAKLAL